MLEDKDYYMPPDQETCCMCNLAAEHILDGEFYCTEHFREFNEEEE